MDVWMSAGFGWVPAVYEAGFLERITVAAYLISALACATAATSHDMLPSDRWFWAVVGAVMAGFGVSKQVDLQTLLSQFARSIAMAEGVLSGRRPFQVLVIILFAAAGGVTAIWIGWRHRRRAAAVRWAGLGLVWMVAFVAVRAVSFHNVDVLIGRAVLGLPVSTILELPGIFMITLAGLSYRVGCRS